MGLHHVNFGEFDFLVLSILVCGASLCVTKWKLHKELTQPLSWKEKNGDLAGIKQGALKRKDIHFQEYKDNRERLEQGELSSKACCYRKEKKTA